MFHSLHVHRNDFPAPFLHGVHAREFGLMLASLLSLGWLVADVAQSPDAFGASSQWNCTSFGRAGAHCVKIPQLSQSSPAKVECVATRGGEICPLVQPPHNGK